MNLNMLWEWEQKKNNSFLSLEEISEKCIPQEVNDKINHNNVDVEKLVENYEEKNEHHADLNGKEKKQEDFVHVKKNSTNKKLHPLEKKKKKKNDATMVRSTWRYENAFTLDYELYISRRSAVQPTCSLLLTTPPTSLLSKTGGVNKQPTSPLSKKTGGVIKPSTSNILNKTDDVNKHKQHVSSSDKKTKPTNVIKSCCNKESTTFKMSSSSSNIGGNSKRLHPSTIPRNQNISEITIASKAMVTNNYIQVKTPTKITRDEYDDECLLKRSNGDVFHQRANDVDGSLYPSPMRKSHAKKSKENFNFESHDHQQQHELSTNSSTLLQSPPSTRTPHTLSTPHTPSNPSHVLELLKKFESKQRCAETLRNWSFNEFNARRMVKEGAIPTIMQLALIDDLLTKQFCATALRNISAFEDLRKPIIQEGAARTLAHLAGHDDTTLQGECAISLCHLTCSKDTEKQLVADGIIPSLMFLLSSHESIATISAWALFNLTCVVHCYYQVERVIKSFVFLATNANMEYRKVCSLAFYNLSNMKQTRIRMVEEGVIQLLASLARGGDTETKRVCCIVIHNLACVRGCHSEMIAKGAIGALTALATTKDKETQYWCAASLCKFTQDPACRTRMVNEGAASALATLGNANQSQDSLITRLSATALHALTCNEESKPKLVENGGVQHLIQMSQSNDVPTKQVCTLALCNLLVSEKAAKDIVQHGAVEALIQLASIENEETQLSWAAALYNISKTEASRRIVVNEGVLPALLHLAQTSHLQTRMYCTAALCHLSYSEENRQQMVDEHVVPCLVQLLQEQNNHSIIEKIVKRCCVSTLCMLSHDVHCARVVVNEGAVLPAIEVSKENDLETKICCCAVLSFLSYHEGNREELVNLGILEALKEFSQLSDLATQRRCAAAFCNLSCNETIRGRMIDAGILPIFSQLSNSYSEENQKDCANGICNLACHPGAEFRLVEDGAVEALMMIAFVRAVSSTAKETCVKALLYLIAPNTLSKMLDEGIVQGFTLLSQLESEEGRKACAIAFCNLSCFTLSRQMIVSKPNALMAINSLMKSSNHEIKCIAGRALAHLLSSQDSLVPTVKMGDALEFMVYFGQCPEMWPLYVQSLFSVSQHDEVRRYLVEGETVKVLPLLLTSQEKEVIYYVLAILCNLAWYEDTKDKLISHGVVAALVTLIIKSTPSKDKIIVLEGARILSYLSFIQTQRHQMVEQNVLQALHHLAQSDCVKTRSLCALILREVSAVKKYESHMIHEGAFQLLCSLSLSTTDEEMMLDCATTMCNFTTSLYLKELAKEENVFEALQSLSKTKNSYTAWCCALSLKALSEVSELPLKMVSCGCTKIIIDLCRKETTSIYTQRNCALALCNLSKIMETRNTMVQDGAVAALILLSASPDEQTKKRCAMALSHLSTTSCNVDDGTVTALISMSMSTSLTPGEEEIERELDDDNETFVPVLPPKKKNRDPLTFLVSSMKEMQLSPIIFVKKASGSAGLVPADIPKVPLLEVHDDYSQTNFNNSSDDGGNESEAQINFEKMEFSEILKQLHDKEGEISDILAARVDDQLTQIASFEEENDPQKTTIQQLGSVLLNKEKNLPSVPKKNKSLQRSISMGSTKSNLMGSTRFQRFANRVASQSFRDLPLESSTTTLATRSFTSPFPNAIISTESASSSLLIPKPFSTTRDTNSHQHSKQSIQLSSRETKKELKMKNDGVNALKQQAEKLGLWH